MIAYDGLYPCRPIRHGVHEAIDRHVDLTSINHVLQPLRSEHREAVLNVYVMPHVPNQWGTKPAEAPLHRLAPFRLSLTFRIQPTDAIFEVVADLQRAQRTQLHQVIEHIADLIMATIFSFGP
eukprot:2501305-Prymnesium_polylepis.1